MIDRPIFSVPKALPRGPHALTRAQVRASQRTRLMAAMAELVGEHGYAAAKISEVATRAGVSAATFYDRFDDKLDCYLAGYDTFAQTLLARIASVLDPDSNWDVFISSTLEAYLGSLEADPVVARAFLIEIDAAGREARKRRQQVFEPFGELIKQRHQAIRDQNPELGPLPDRVYLAIVLAVRELAAEELDRTREPQLRALAPDILVMIEAIIRGAQEPTAVVSLRTRSA